ncbi:MAG: GTP-binding protein gtr1 [Peltula sp. TS41687]|nr:MAG: GTP-binding protein gtr1 [Peltula sp. TS41687]
MDQPKPKKQKVLLMGKSGSGKSSMRSIVFSNFVAKDTRRLGATIDVETSHLRLLGNLTLNLWDCGGQNAFVENYLSSQADHVFSNVGVLIYVFDIESREFDRDLVTYASIIRALSERSPGAIVFSLIHKMDLVNDHFRERIFRQRVAAVRARSGPYRITAFPTSIWDQSLYKAWSRIIYMLIPNVGMIEQHLRVLAAALDAEEIVLFERSTFLVVTTVTSPVGEMNPCKDRFERLSNIIKTFKQSLSKTTGLPKANPQFAEFGMKTTKFNLFVGKFTFNTYILVCVGPGEATFNTAVLNTKLAREHFEKMEGLGKGVGQGPGEKTAGNNKEDAADGFGGKEKDDGGEGSSTGREVSSARDAGEGPSSTGGEEEDSRIVEALEGLTVKEREGGGGDDE